MLSRSLSADTPVSLSVGFRATEAADKWDFFFFKVMHVLSTHGLSLALTLSNTV